MKKKGYIFKRLIRSLLSVLAIMTIVFVLLYSLVPRTSIFNEDGTYKKLGGKPDEKQNYIMTVWEKLEYVDYVSFTDYCLTLYEQGSPEIIAALNNDSKEAKDFINIYTQKGYVIDELPISKTPYAYRDTPIITRLLSWFKGLIVIDTPWSVQDPNNPDLERKLYFGTTPTGGIALCGSGTYHKYLLYTDTNFPFIHQNIISINMGISYPKYEGSDVLEVIFDYQGEDVKRDITYETGVESESGIIFGTLTYKSILDRIDINKFNDHYANYKTLKNQSSMIGTSFIMGIFALILSYAIGLPCGLAMAKNKDKLPDKLGMLYIIFIIAVPSLAYIYLFRYLGTTIFGLPSAFPIKGAEDITSWILPIVSLALPSIAGLMLWTRRYVVDQMNSDYVKFARAKGLNEKEIFNKHVFKNAIIPIAQGIPSSLAGCITGAIITESIYSVGGMGKMLPDSIKSYNNSMVVALTFIFSTISVLSVLLGDLVLTWVDPRISLAEKEGRS